MPDIANNNDIKTMVDTFYLRVRQDQILGSIFDERIGDRWPDHLEKMYKFWGSMLLGDHSYHGHPFAPHATLPIEKDHFKMWLLLFNETVTELFSGPIAEQALFRAELMAEMFAKRLALAE